ncbi:MAG TPA: DHA2 family efflux MFS transporter permease subunit [Syntrophales bacterium]|nr:DHA2 family efflux MFS transporter permease subunit [Syntrophales bacterium]
MRRYLIFGSVSLGLLMYSIDSTIVAVAFSSFMEDLRVNVIWASWTISIYYIAITTTMPLAGNLSDAFGRKRVFLVSLVLFTAGSLACGLANNIYTLIAFRALQGIGGASFLPTASGIVSDYFPENRERMIGLFSSIFPIGGVVGPNLGGWIVAHYSWRYIFYINLPIGVILIVLIMMLLTDSKVHAPPHIDFKGAFFMSGAILFLMLGLNTIAENFSAFNFLVSALFTGLSCFLLALFFRQEKGETNPILDLTLLRSTPFLATNILNLLMGALVFGTFAFIPLYATSVHKLSTLMSGMILTPRSIGMIPASAITAFLLRRWGYRKPMFIGFIIISFSIILLQDPLFLRVIGIQIGIPETLSLLILVMGIGVGITAPAVNNACIELMPEKVASIVGLRGMFRTVGGALGVSLTTFILHVSGNYPLGFSITFSSFGLGLLCTLPLVFLVPAGKSR